MKLYSWRLCDYYCVLGSFLRIFCQLGATFFPLLDINRCLTVIFSWFSFILWKISLDFHDLLCYKICTLCLDECPQQNTEYSLRLSSKMFRVLHSIFILFLETIDPHERNVVILKD